MATGDDWRIKVRALFDEFADREWDRLDADLPGKVSFLVHREMLERYIKPGMRVLEIGAGPGRFTLELARLGARVSVTDISPVQLDLNRRTIETAGLESAIEQHFVLDVCEVNHVVETGSFDAVVAFGGPYSYVLEKAESAIAQTLAVLKPLGMLLASVMDLHGALRYYLNSVPLYHQEGRVEELDAVVRTSDNRKDSQGHPCRFFTWQQILDIAGDLDCTVIDGAASNFYSGGDQPTLEYIAQHPELWETFLRWELDACFSTGSRDGGTHLLFALQRC